MKRKLLQKLARFLCMGSVFVVSASLFGQETTTTAAPEEEEEIETLSPFTVDASEQSGYLATSTLAGTRIKTQLSDVGSAISVMTTEFMQDLSGSDNETLLSYMVSSEVGGPRGNFSGGVSTNNPREAGLFANPNGNTRIRGLSRADNTRNFFLTDIPWDNYIVDRVDLQRGPNAILFGLGSPAGVVNATTHSAVFDTFGQARVRFDEFGSVRGQINYNYEILENQLAVRGAALMDRTKFRQDPSFEDDDRLFVAVKYAPDYLMNNESTRFEMKASYEVGTIEANRPRTVTPQDRLSSWWLPREQGGLEAPDGSKYAHYVYGGNPNDPLWEWPDETLGHRAHFSEGGGQYWNSNSFPGAPWVAMRVANYGHLNENGQVINEDDINGSVHFRNQHRHLPESSMYRMEQIDAPFFLDGFYQDASMQDPGLYDFYNNLLEGPNKRNFTDWQAFELEVTNTFFNDRLGYNLAYFNQDLQQERYGIMGVPVESGYAIYVDINATTFQNAPNRDFGRPMILADPGGYTTGTGESDRETLRAQVFGEYDFRDNFDNIFGTIFGLHRVTGLYSDDSHKTDNRSHRLWDYAPEFYTGNPNISPTQGSFSTAITYYLGPSMADLSSPEGVQIGRVNEFIIPRTSAVRSMTLWDPTWIADSSIDPGDPWPGIPPRSENTQSANPANYRGWVQRDVEVVSFLDPGSGPYNGLNARDYLASGGSLSKSDIESLVLVWQAYLWNDSIVGTYGYREDTANSQLFKAEDRPSTNTDAYPGYRGVFVHPDRYFLGADGTFYDKVETETKNWSVAVHAHRVLGPKFDDFLPFNLSVYYNEGENFQPLAGRVDYFGLPLPPPGGVTEDRSILISTKDNRYSLRVTKFETAVQNQNSTGSISQLWKLQQSIFQTAWSRARTEAGQGGWTYADHPDPERYENTILPAWKQLEAEMLQLFPDFINAWVYRQGGNWPLQVGDRAGPPPGAKFTEDAVSKGYEFEFIANPMPNWRISLNASQTEAVRDNVPGESFRSIADWFDDKIMNTPAGEMPYWWVASPPLRSGALYPGYRGQYLSLLALNGQPQPEIREWRFNGVTNYTFTEGRYKGLGLGGAFRWQDKYAVDFPPIEDADGLIQRDIDNPFEADSELDIDLWASYVFNLTDDIRWRVQLNVYNAFGNNKLIPINTDPFGNWQAVRIKEGRSWAITNTIDF